ncbi:Hypothetical protein NTJ_01273 [Nesidiocoris tenuis]|uniref:Uncharacterized protein n=1 Tax=Nesidiocoris tenuis TaxID=355587 RepID=A0ABN7A849_9HEMI|nr:Hypothetical protein NTJ_01273 [Nesidiocoris tenuis]
MFETTESGEGAFENLPLATLTPAVDNPPYWPHSLLQSGADPRRPSIPSSLAHPLSITPFHLALLQPLSHGYSLQPPTHRIFSLPRPECSPHLPLSWNAPFTLGTSPFHPRSLCRCLSFVP